MKNKYMKGFIAGSLIGIGAGMLLLPSVSGEVRRKIVNGGKNVVENMTNRFTGNE